MVLDKLIDHPFLVFMLKSLRGKVSVYENEFAFSNGFTDHVDYCHKGSNPKEGVQ
jgi:hypothetical protein